MPPAAAAAAVHTALAGAPAHDEWRLDECESGGASASWSVSEWEGLETCEMESRGETRSMLLGGESGYRGASILGCWVRWNWFYACGEGEEAHCLRSDAMRGWCTSESSSRVRGSMLQKESQDNSSKWIEKSALCCSCVHRYSVVSVGDIKAVGIVVDSVEQVELVIQHSHCLTRYGTVTKTVPVVQLLARSLQPTIPLSFPLVPDTVANVTHPQQLWPMTLDHQSQCQRAILTHTSEHEQNCRLHPIEQIEGFLKLDPLWGGVLHRAGPNRLLKKIIHLWLAHEGYERVYFNEPCSCGHRHREYQYVKNGGSLAEIEEIVLWHLERIGKADAKSRAVIASDINV
ncbi:hypothetical protein B0H13DRAFT_1884215 [Mycena leptocephala]|nr:hypothetical protein B0H13DRAFT_1884215 [Mycena leptocephala]